MRQATASLARSKHLRIDDVHRIAVRKRQHAFQLRRQVRFALVALDVTQVRRADGVAVENRDLHAGE